MKKGKVLFKGELPPPPPAPRPKIVKLAHSLVGHRLELYRKSLGMKGYIFCTHIGVSQGSYSDLKNNKSLPSCNTITNIINLEECCICWLLTGRK